MKKKLIVIVLLMLMASGVAGCEKDTIQFSTKETRWEYPAILRSVVPYEEGFYYMKDYYWLSYFDTESKTSMILCDRSGCKHNDEECFAYMDVSDLPFVLGNKLFFVDYDKILVSNLDNTEKETYMTIAEEHREKESSAIWMQPTYIMTGHTIYAVMQEDDYQSGEMKQMLWAIDLETKKETEIISVDGNEKSIELLSAKDNVLYYTIQSRSPLYEKMELTLEELQEIEKTREEEVYRIDLQTGKNELIKKIENGVCSIANDESGVYYGEFLGDGYWKLRSLFHIDPETKEEEKVLEHTEDSGIDIGYMSSSEDMKMEIRVGTECFLYDMKTFTPIAFPEAISNETVIYSVPGGYAYQMELEESVYDWYYLPESETRKENGTAILAE